MERLTADGARGPEANGIGRGLESRGGAQRGREGRESIHEGAHTAARSQSTELTPDRFFAPPAIEGKKSGAARPERR